MPPVLKAPSSPGAPPQVKIQVTHTGSSAAAAARGVQSAVKGVQAVQKPGAAKTVSSAKAVAGRAAAAGSQPAAFDPLYGYQNPSQLAGLANRITVANTNADLTPLRQSAGQLRNSENTVLGRYQGYMSTANSALAGLQSNAAGSAATDENLAAQQAASAANQIDQTGAAAKALNGGYLDPQVAAALQNQAQFAGTTLGAQAQATAQNGSSLGDYLTSLRAAAALQGPEGAANIISAFQKPIAANQAQQQALIAKENPTARSLAATLGQQQFSDYATLKGLGVKQATLNADIANNNAKNAIAAENANTNASYKQGQLALTSQNDQANQRVKAATLLLDSNKLTAQQQHWAQQMKLDYYRLAHPTSSATAGATVANRISGAVSYYRLLMTVGGSKGKISQNQALAGAATDLEKYGAAGQAAVELLRAGSLTPATIAALRAQGVPIDKSWLPRTAAAQRSTSGTAGVTGSTTTSSSGGSGVQGSVR